MRYRTHRHFFRAFTLLELLVVMAIVGTLAVISLSVLPGIRERSKAGKRTSDLRQIVTAMTLFSSENNGYFPRSGSVVPYGAVDPTTGLPGWQEQLDPYVDGNRRLFAGPDFKLIGDGVYRVAYFNGSQAAYVAAQEAGTLPEFQSVQASRISHPSKYIIAGEIRIFSFDPQDADADNYSQDPLFGGGIQQKPVVVAFADGHAGTFKQFDPDLMMTTYSTTNSP